MMISYCTKYFWGIWKTRTLLVLVVLLLVACNQKTESESQTTATATIQTPERDILPDPVIVKETPSFIEPGVIPTTETGSQVSNTPTPNPFEEIPGALIQVSMQSQVGILLDEFPEEIREEVVANLMTQSEEMWPGLARAARQVRLTRLLMINAD